MVITLIILLIVKASVKRKGASGEGVLDELDFSSLRDEYADISGGARGEAAATRGKGESGQSSDGDF